MFMNGKINERKEIDELRKFLSEAIRKDPKQADEAMIKVTETMIQLIREIDSDKVYQVTQAYRDIYSTFSEYISEEAKKKIKEIIDSI